MKTLFYLLLMVVTAGTLGAQSATFNNGRTFAETTPIRTELEPFFHGVASGDPLEDRVIIWTRVTPDSLTNGPVDVSWRVATDPELENVVATGDFVTSSTRDYTVKIDVTGLAAGTTYYYGFTALGANSLTGKTKTTPTGDAADHLKFGVVSCSNYQAGFFNAYGRLADRTDLDAIVHLGDYIYEYANFVYGSDSVWNDRLVSPGDEIVSLFDYRSRYSTYRLDTNLIRAHQQHPIISVWDDHESANDAYEDGAENHQPETEGSWESRKDRARRVYFEWMPIRDTGNRSIYRKISYGNLADLIMLDTRLEGRDEQPTSVLDSNFLDPNRSMLGAEQKEWFFNQLSGSQAKWKIVGQQVIFSEFNVGWAGATTGASFTDTEDIFLDIWDGYPAERRQITGFLAQQELDNVVLLTGDFHSSFAFEVADPPVDLQFRDIPGAGTLPFYDPTDNYDPATGAGAVAVEFATPSISAANFDENTSVEVAAGLQFQINSPINVSELLSLGNPNPHMKYAELIQHGYFVLDVRDEGVQADYFYGDILVPTTEERFGAGYFSPADTSRLTASTTPADPKATQDVPAPANPPVIISSTQEASVVKVLSVFPNPATETCNLQYATSSAGLVNISLLDANGRQVRTSREQRQPAGLYTYRVDVRDLPVGVYFLRIRANGSETVQSFVKQ